MSYTIAPAARAILDQATGRWPNRSRISDGTIGDASHSSRTSDHNPDWRGIVHAADLTHDPAHGCDNNVNAERVKDDRRVKYVIWNRRIWNPSVSRSWRPYTGSNPHDHHMHVSILSGSSVENDTSPWFGPLPMSSETRAHLLAASVIAARLRPELEVTRPVTRGPDVSDVQRIIGAPVTGRYGRGTEKRVKAFQAFFGIPVDGVVGQRTWATVLFIAAARYLGY